MNLNYLVCMDIETAENLEIIEFAAVLLNLETGLIETQFKYLRMEPCDLPRMNPAEALLFTVFSPFLGTTNTYAHLFDITKNVIDTFDEWLKEKDLVFVDGNNRKQNAAVCTWTDHDIGVYLRGEYQRRSIPLHDHFRRRIDAQEVYKSHTREYEDITFTDALRRIGVFSRRDRLYSMENARNLSRMMLTIAQSGYEFQITNFE